MATGPGIYDGEATAVRVLTGASTVILIVLGGSGGSGFSVQTDDPTMQAQLPGLLRTVATQIEGDTAS